MKKKIAPVTLRALAEQLQMHVSTVSGVLNGSPEDARNTAAPATVARIQELAKKLDCRPNPYAIGLKTQQSRTGRRAGAAPIRPGGSHHL